MKNTDKETKKAIAKVLGKFFLIFVLPFIVIYVGARHYINYVCFYSQCCECGKKIHYSFMYCDEHRCNEPGCNYPKLEDKKGYCREHYNEHFPRYCKHIGCNVKLEYDYDYCFAHMCFAVDCDEPTYGDTSYCKNHQDHIPAAKESKKETEKKCTAGRTYCSTHYSQVTGPSPIDDKWPDVNDYEDMEEFLDDWDGELPDDYDAEDYWFDYN